MSYFLLEYRRSTGKLLASTIFVNATEASTRRFEREVATRDDRDVEVVVLSGSDIEDIKRTHARYFGDLSELAAKRLVGI